MGKEFDLFSTNKRLGESTRVNDIKWIQDHIEFPRDLSNDKWRISFQFDQLGKITFVSQDNILWNHCSVRSDQDGNKLSGDDLDSYTTWYLNGTAIAERPKETAPLVTKPGDTVTIELTAFPSGVTGLSFTLRNPIV